MIKWLRIKFIAVLLFNLPCVSGFTQSNISLKGFISDIKGNAIPYVNIGIAGKKTGTVSNVNGLFILELDSRLLQDSIRFSSIGYISKVLKIQDMVGSDSTNHHIVLVSAFTALPEVIVTPKNLKIKVLGNTTRSKFMSGGFSSNELGAEAGTRIKIRKRPAYLEKVSFHLSYNKLDSIKIRLNIYAMNDGKPAENILPENIILRLRDKQVGNVEVDLSKYDLMVKDDILIALQLVEGKGDFRSSVFISASMLGNPTYYREASHSTWKVYKGLSIGINVTVKQ